MLSVSGNETTSTITALDERIRTRTARICVVGLGYVGLPLAVAFARAGFSVYGVEQNPIKVRQVLDGQDYIRGEEGGELADLVTCGRLDAGNDYDRVTGQDVIIICVPTPLTRNREPDISYVTSVTTEVSRRLRVGQLVVLESTTYPGTTEEVVKPLLDKSNLKAGIDYHLAFSPERVDPGNQEFQTENTPKIIGGLTPECSRLTGLLYEAVIASVHTASSPRVAEMVKLLENIFRCVNIALVNELALLSRRMDIDIWEVVRLASTKPYGFMPFFPGPGLGGHCIPIDPFYLSWKAREYDFHTRFIELAGEVNMQMPSEVVKLVVDALGTNFKSLRGSHVLVLGAAYKRDVADHRESPSLKIIDILERRGARVDYNDDLIPHVKINGHMYHSVPLERLDEYDCVVIATDHSAYDYEDIVKRGRLVVDTRNATGARGAENVFIL